MDCIITLGLNINWFDMRAGTKMGYQAVHSDLKAIVRDIIVSKRVMVRDLMRIVLKSGRVPLTVTDLCRIVRPEVGEITPKFMRKILTELGYTSRMVSVDSKVYRAILS